MISIGNKSDVDDADLVRHFSEDESTKSILIYMEGLKNGKKFLEASKETNRKKPIIVIKAGRTKSGAGAASSHTGSIAGRTSCTLPLSNRLVCSEQIPWSRHLTGFRQ